MVALEHVAVIFVLAVAVGVAVGYQFGALSVEYRRYRQRRAAAKAGILFFEWPQG